MALEFICSQNINKGMRISIPKGECNAFRIKSGEIKFFRYNPTLPKGIQELPKNSAKISFEGYHPHRGWIHYGKPTFYDLEGNIINAEGEI